MKNVDVIIVGAGFAGVTAARELGFAGKNVVVLEARDRIGGRTWLDERLGKPLELGGTWLHWTQPFIWAEITRYGIGTVQSPVPTQAWWVPNDKPVEIDPDELIVKMDAANREFTAESRIYFENPYKPLDHPTLAEVDKLTVKEKLDTIEMDDDVRGLMESFWSLNFNGLITEGAYTQALRWAALTNGDWAVNFEACATYKFEGGTKRLIEAMAADVRGEIKLDTPVQKIDTSGERVIVSTVSGETYSAGSVIVTVGLHTLAHIDFAPPLTAKQTAAIEKGQASKGTKVWIKAKGPLDPFVAFGKAEWPLNFFQADVETAEGDRLIIGFGPDQRRIDPLDREAVAEVLHRIRPDIEVLDVAAHNWVEDEFSEQTWPMHKPGFLSQSLAEFQHANDKVLFAGSDFASGWCGFFDGAIESGFTAARAILNRSA